jgi:hypothetical protein
VPTPLAQRSEVVGQAPVPWRCGQRHLKRPHFDAKEPAGMMGDQH